MIDKWLKNMKVSLLIDSEQVTMKDREAPMQNYRELFFDVQSSEALLLELGPNEFT